jgi:hypothetical protein
MANSRTDKNKTARARTANQAAAQPSAPRGKSRLTLDVPESLHFAMRMQATATKTPMVDEVTPLLLEHYADAMRRFPLPPAT